MQLLHFPRGLKALFLAIMMLISVTWLVQNQVILGGVTDLGYPPHLVTLLGLGYGAGAAGIARGASAMIREWAYVGFSFAFAGAIADRQPPANHSASESIF